MYDEWERTLRDANAVDFDDLLVLPVRVLQLHPDRVAAYRERFRFLLVDEYQDTNRAQYELVKLLAACRRQRARCWRRRSEHLRVARCRHPEHPRFRASDFPSAVVVRLEDNYRSTPQVLDLANAVISANVGRRGKTLRATLPPGDAVTQVATLDERDEAEFVAEEITTSSGGARALDLSRDCRVVPHQLAEPRARGIAAQARHSVSPRGRGALLRPARDSRPHELSQADRESGGRRSLSARRVRAAVGAWAMRRSRRSPRSRTMRDCPMLEVASDSARLASLRPAARQALADFSSLILRQRENAKDSSVDELLRNVIEEIRFADHLKAEGPEGMERIENVKELIAGAAETVADEGGELGLTPLDHFLQHASLITDVDRRTPMRTRSR